MCGHVWAAVLVLLLCVFRVSFGTRSLVRLYSLIVLGVPTDTQETLETPRDPGDTREDPDTHMQRDVHRATKTQRYREKHMKTHKHTEETKGSYTTK